MSSSEIKSLLDQIDAVKSDNAKLEAELGGSTGIKLTYFNIQGPAEAPRLALTIGGIAFEDIRVSREEMTALKEAGKLPSGQLPVLEVDGKTLHQSQAMATYAAKRAGLYPEDPWAAAKVDEITQLVLQDIRERCISPTMREKDETKKMEARKELAEVKLPEKFRILESLIQPSGFCVGDSLTIADLHVYVLLNWLGMEVLDGVSKQVVLDFAKLKNLCSVINEIPAVKAWNAKKNTDKVPWF
jgi:glutathione S-transferase